MLYDLELTLKRSLKREWFTLPLGARRLWIATSVAWLLIYLALNWNDLTLLWDGATSTPSTTCAEVFAGGDERRSACEIARGLPDIGFYLQGKSMPFQPYFAANRHDEKLFVWLGGPLAWLSLIWAFFWVRRGFAEGRGK